MWQYLSYKHKIFIISGLGGLVFLALVTSWIKICFNCYWNLTCYFFDEDCHFLLVAAGLVALLPLLGIVVGHWLDNQERWSRPSFSNYLKRFFGLLFTVIFACLAALMLVWFFYIVIDRIIEFVEWWRA